FGLGFSWGGFESLAIPITVPARHAGRPGDEPVWLVRLHIGLEDVEDLWADLEAALK
ncbi:MAG TPA: PLP-dependent transferase, partial [Chthonomonadaceae bacterium]|nr:PLP-dependent transferase [Chthonomonadaceae bacterium]